MKQVLFVAVIATFAAFSTATTVNKCKSDLPLPLSVDVINCDASPCDLAKGATIYMNLTFDAPNDLETFEPKIIAHVLGMDVDYPLKEKDGCNELIDGECPLEEGERVLYGTSIDIPSDIPNVDFGIELTLYTEDENGDNFPFSCFQLDGKVVG